MNKELDRLVYQEISEMVMTYSEMIDTMNYAVSLLKEEGQDDNEITDNLRDTISYLEQDLWKEVLEDEDRYNDFENDND